LSTSKPITLQSKGSPGAIKKALADADRYARNKQYPCLFPGCDAEAISSHSIQMALCSSALAERGKLYTVEQSFIPRPNRPTFTWYREIVETGIRDAGTFCGYCSDHDYRLFDPAESATRAGRSGMIEALHRRGVSLHYSRQRRCADFFQKLASLLSGPKNKKICEDHALGYKDEAGLFDLLYLQRGVARSFPTKQGISYYCIPISRNLEVSCCGCFKANTDWHSGITYNLISYTDITILLLTEFEATKHHLDSFTEKYSIPRDVERLVNEMVFAISEAPLIAPRLWHSLSDEQKRDLRLSLQNRQLHIEAPSDNTSYASGY
jgi:hypothetical protein